MKDQSVIIGCILLALPGLLLAGCSSRSNSVASAAIPLPMGGNISGTLLNVDPAQRHLTLKAANGSTYQVSAAHAAILTNGHEGSFSDLRQGSPANIVAIAMDQKTMEIEARQVSVAVPGSGSAAIASVPPTSGDAVTSPTSEAATHQSEQNSKAVASAAPTTTGRVREPTPRAAVNLAHSPTARTRNAVLPTTDRSERLAATTPGDTTTHNDAAIDQAGLDQKRRDWTRVDAATPGSDMPINPAANPGHRPGRRQSHTDDQNSSASDWEARENRKAREREWRAEASQMQGGDEQSHHAHSHRRSDDSSDGDGDVPLTPSEQRALEKGEEAIMKGDE